MKTAKEQPKQIRPMTESEAEAVIRKYFGDVEVDVEAYWSMGSLRISVGYYDFKLARTVRDDLERLIPFADVQVVRDFSDKIMFKVFKESYQNDLAMDVPHDGHVFRLSIVNIVYAFLNNKDLSAVKDVVDLFD